MVEYITTLLIMICIMGVLASALVEVLKTVFGIKDQYIINICVLIISELLVAVSFHVYFDLKNVSVGLYEIPLSIVCGILSTGIAIFGFDKYFKPLFENIKGLLQYFGR